jgi:hypothetical protein
MAYARLPQHGSRIARLEDIWLEDLMSYVFFLFNTMSDVFILLEVCSNALP